VNELSSYSLVADIGGTNARFALVNNTREGLVQVRQYDVKKYKGLLESIEAYFSDIGGIKPQNGCLAIAAPVSGDDIVLTNSHWRFSLEQTQASLGMERLLAVNDFEAIALSIPTLSKNDVHEVIRGESVASAPKLVIGPGTGLGVSALIEQAEHSYVLKGEGGHVAFAAMTEKEQAVSGILARKYGRVTAEQILSGPGILYIYNALVEISGAFPEYDSPEQIYNAAMNKSCQVSRDVMRFFLDALGSFCGDLALAFGAKGGVVLAGGIVPRFLEHIDESSFRQRFKDKGRMTGFVKGIPAHVIINPLVGLVGAAECLKR